MYCFKTVLFGAVNSPFILYATLYHHLQQRNIPLSNDIQTSLNVDNVVSGRATEAEAVQYFHDSRAMLSETGFNLRAWMCNNQQLLAITEQDKTMHINTSTPSNVLEIHWNVMSDQSSLIPKMTRAVATKI